MAFPPSFEIEVLKKVHPSYNAKKLALYNALYEGGSAFHRKDVIEQILIKRQLERLPEGTRIYEMRKERSQYINRAGGFVDWFDAAVFAGEIKIISPEGNKFWEGLNENADGLGTSFSTLCRQLLNAMMIDLRSYLKVSFDHGGEEIRPDEKEKLGATLSVVRAKEIDDWEWDAEGELDWARAHSFDLIRPVGNPFDTPDRERHTWTFYGKNEIAIYEAIKKIDENFQKDAIAQRVIGGMPSHDFGRPPLIDIRATHGQWLMERIFDVIKAGYNREAALTWALDTQAYALMVLHKEDKVAPKVYGSELMALLMGVNETVTFAAPESGIFEPLFKDVERLSSDLREVIHAMAINAAAIPQAGRLSAQAVAAMRDPMVTLLDSFAQPIEEAVLRAIRAIQKYRGEENLEIELEGFNQHSAERIPMPGADGDKLGLGQPCDPSGRFGGKVKIDQQPVEKI